MAMLYIYTYIYMGGSKPTTAQGQLRQATPPVGRQANRGPKANSGKPTNRKRRQATTHGRRQANCGKPTNPICIYYYDVYTWYNTYYRFMFDS
ncbi:MAG: hypothetical protein ACKPKO_64805 [Candidatus Fonsibacter sp.]